MLDIRGRRLCNMLRVNGAKRERVEEQRKRSKPQARIFFEIAVAPQYMWSVC
ncbi:hypothetical protein FIBSPDRAFT_847128, partial [Athelia psychrophila]